MSEALVVGQSVAADRSSGRNAIIPVSPEAVRNQLSRILSSKAFARSPRISRFLTFVVEQTLERQEDKLKEYMLGVEVFGRLDSFDPRIDSIVRVEARRLRYKLEKYYESEGPDDSVYIQFRKGCYVPSFSEKRPGEPDVNGDLNDVPNVRPIGNPHAFALYARGRFNLGTWTADGIAEAVACFSHALEEENDCASAHSGLGSAWMLTSLLGLMPSRDVVPKARSSALRALAISPAHSEAQSIAGVAAALYDWEWTEAEPKLRKAILANPADTDARLWYGLYLILAGRTEEAIREIRRVQQAEPTSVTAHMCAGFACQAAKAYNPALQHYRLVQDLSPSFYGAWLAMGLLLTEQGLFEQASNMLERAAQLSPKNPLILASMAYHHAAAGRPEDSRKSSEEVARLASQQYVSPVIQASAHAAAGDIDAAYRKLDEAVQERATWLPVVRFAPAFEGVREDPRYAELLGHMRLEVPVQNPVS